MSARERFLKIARSELKDTLFFPCDLNYGWFMEETLARWKKEGMPDADICAYCGFERVRFIPGDPYALYPPFEERILRKDGDTLIVREGTGVTKRVFQSSAEGKMPQWLDFPVKTRKDWKSFVKRLNPHSQERYIFEPDAAGPSNERRHILGIAPGSFYGHTLQRWVGTENLCMLFYDDPGFVQEMLEYLEHFFLQIAGRILAGNTFDFAAFGEDIAYKGRSFISPGMFKRFFQPRYVKICDLLHSNGIDVIFVDSDGNIEELIPLWMDVGINGFSPLEAAAGMDAMSLKKKYGKNIVLAGNVDKRALISGRTALDLEIGKVKRLLREGGYFPAVDHAVPPDVPWENFRYFLSNLQSTESNDNPLG